MWFDSEKTFFEKEKLFPDAKFEFLKDSNMPDGVDRYTIKDKNNEILWNFFECKEWSVNFGLVEKSNLKDYLISAGWKNKTALIMPLPFVGTNFTEWIIISNWQKSWETINYWWDNAIVWFKNGKSGIIKIKVWDNLKLKTKSPDFKIKPFNPSDQELLDNVLNPQNWYTLCQQISIMDQWQKSCDYVWTTKNDWWRKYRFYVETFRWTMWVVDFRQNITINQAVEVMKNNWIKNAVYADIISYNMYFGDKDWVFYTREEWNNWQSSYKKLPSTDVLLPNKNSLIIIWK